MQQQVRASWLEHCRDGSHPDENYRTSDTGYASRLHVFSNAFSRLTVSKPRTDVPLFRPRGVFRAAESAERMALFMAFGIDDAHVHRNIRYLKTRRYWVERLKHSTVLSLQG